MKKIVVILAALLIVPMALAVNDTVGDGGSEVLNVGAQVNSEGNVSVVEFAWILPDDLPTAGTQIDIVPSDTHDDIYACIVMSDPEGRETIGNVYAEVYLPNGEHKYQKHAVKMTDTAEIEECKALAVSAGLITQEEADHIDLYIDDKQQYYMYKVYLPMLYHQPAGDYVVEFWGTDLSGVTSDILVGGFLWIPTIVLEYDFNSGIDFGSILPGYEKMIPGDEDLTTSGLPTLKNEGNIPIQVGVEFTNLTGINHSKVIDRFDVQFQSFSRDFNAYAMVWADDCLQICQTKQIDFSIHPETGIPNDVYEGDMTLFARDNEFVCVEMSP